MPSIHNYFGDLVLTRLLIQRGMAAIYLVAFITVIRQFKPLLGEHGLLPVPEFLHRTTWRETPSLFHWRYSDRLLDLVAWTGLLISALRSLSASPKPARSGSPSPPGSSLYVLYLSIVNVGQNFFGFGWESMLLEAGFFTAFLGPFAYAALHHPDPHPALDALPHRSRRRPHQAAPRPLLARPHLPVLPLRNPAAPQPAELVLPPPAQSDAPLLRARQPLRAGHRSLRLFAPQPIAAIAGALIIFQQLWLIVSGNYSWLNWLTVVLGFAAFDDRILSFVLAVHTYRRCRRRPLAFDILLYLLAAATVALSIQPALNLISPTPAHELQLQPLSTSSTAYGAFGQVGRERYEIVIEGTTDRVITPATQWREYGFKAKPGDPKRTPPQIAPYHLRLDWLIWFLPFSVVVTPSGIRVPGYSRWFFNFVQQLLTADRAILRLMGPNPFPEAPPAFIRALFYRYRYTTPERKRQTGAWWSRQLLGTYLQPISLDLFEKM